MTHHAPIYTTLDDWIAHGAIPFSVEQPETFHAAIDKVIASLGDAVELLGFGEALHSGEDILIYTWWPAGSHLDQWFGPRYAVIGTGLGVSDAIGIAQSEVGSLEVRLAALRSAAVFIPTHKGQGLSASEIAALPTRSGSMKNPTYFALNASPTSIAWLSSTQPTTPTEGGR